MNVLVPDYRGDSKRLQTEKFTDSLIFFSSSLHQKTPVFKKIAGVSNELGSLDSLVNVYCRINRYENLF